MCVVCFPQIAERGTQDFSTRLIKHTESWGIGERPSTVGRYMSNIEINQFWIGYNFEASSLRRVDCNCQPAENKQNFFWLSQFVNWFEN
jgi:hypothetical protein